MSTSHVRNVWSKIKATSARVGKRKRVGQNLGGGTMRNDMYRSGPANRSNLEFEILRTPNWTIRHCSDVAVVGYLLIVSNDISRGFTDLSQSAIEELGMLLNRTTKAVEAAVNPERVYVCMFGESNSAPHFHIFPRMKWMTDVMQDTIGQAAQPIDGAAVFSRIRLLLSLPSHLQKEETRIAEVVSAIRKLMANASRPSAGDKSR